MRPAAAREGSGYAEFVAGALASQTGDLGRTWARRGAGAVGATRPDAAFVADTAPDSAPAEEIVRTLISAAADGSQWQERVMRAGWNAGTRAFWREASLHQLLKELDAGLTLVLSAAAAATEEYAGSATALDGLALARRLSDAASLLRLAAAGGYTRVMADDLRQRYRTIRHDLRNPLGTIATAVAMMDDETLPEATRQNPRVRAMLARNARSMEHMISATLGDAAARLPAIALQPTSLHALACAVRGDLRAASYGVNVLVSDDLPTFPFDAAGLELLLKAVILAFARDTGGEAEVMIALAGLGPRTATLAVFAPGEDGAGPADLDLAFPRELVARLGGRVSLGDGRRVLIEIPVEPLDTERPRVSGEHQAVRSVPRGDALLGDARDDVAGQRESPHGEPRRL